MRSPIPPFSLLIGLLSVIALDLSGLWLIEIVYVTKWLLFYLLHIVVNGLHYRSHLRLCCLLLKRQQSRQAEFILIFAESLNFLMLKFCRLKYLLIDVITLSFYTILRCSTFQASDVLKKFRHEPIIEFSHRII